MKWIINEIEQGPTFVKIVREQNSNKLSMRSSYIDLTIINDKVKSKIEWLLRDHVIDTEHKLIEINLDKKIKNDKVKIRLVHG